MLVVVLVVSGVCGVAFWIVELRAVTAGRWWGAIVVVERSSSRVTNLIGSDPLLWVAAFVPLLWVTAFAGVVIRGVISAVRVHGRASRASRAPHPDQRDQ